MRLSLAWLILLCSLPAALAQFSARGEVAFGADGALSQAFPAQVGWALSGHLHADYRVLASPGNRIDPVTLRLVLTPAVRFSQEVKGDLGLSELYIAFSLRSEAATLLGALDLSLGLARLPLEYARLSLPFSLEPTGRFGQRQGVPGVQLTWYADDWRLRGALVYRQGLVPLLSLRRSFGGFELEAHALYAEHPVFGLGGSGLIGDLVIYGEGWLLLTPLEARGALGLTGFWEDALWTLEAAWLPPAEKLFSLRSDPLLAARPVVLGQLALPLGEAGSLSLFASGAFDPDALRFTVLASYSHLEAEREVSASLRAHLGPEPPVVGLSLKVTDFF